MSTRQLTAIVSCRVTSDSIGRPLPPDAPIDPLDDDPTPPEGEPVPSKAIDRQIRTILEWVAVAVGALAVALIIKSLLLQAFYIPSGSMEETLQRGDRVLVNKLSYDLHDVRRGDVVVFEKPPGEGGEIDDLIKRVIALPGETVSFQDGSILIDGLLLEEPYIEPGVPSLAKVPIPNCDGEAPAADSCMVPDGRIFVMGDNREESRDSRFFGPIEDQTIVGRAFLKVWPLTDIGFL
jgi:signal peptidase I